MGEFIYVDLFNWEERIQLFTTQTEESPPYRIPKRRIPSGDTSSNAALQWVKDWLDYCVREHRKCRVGRQWTLPTRVIDVTSLNECGDVRLVDKAHLIPSARYVALSHCWGNKVPECHTTRQSLDVRKKCIPFALLPKTFKGAVVFTRGLGVRYLWIDSICIIQEDPHDWRHEASRMREVFGNSFVTIAAVHARDCSGGPFVKLPNEFNAFRLSPINIGGKYWQLSARRLLPTFHSWFPLAMGNRIPLFERAWAYQERLVSPRVVYFTQHEVLWECFECIGCECIGDASTASQFPPAYADDCPKIRHIKLLDQGQVAERWHPIVEEYSRLGFDNRNRQVSVYIRSCKTDPAASTIRSVLAGLWSNTLVQDLLWCRATWNPKGFRPKTWCAPTWSWASIAGGVNYKLDAHESNPLGDRYFVEVLEATCKYIEDQELGEVEPGKLVLRAQLTECTLDLRGGDQRLKTCKPTKTLDELSWTAILRKHRRVRDFGIASPYMF